MTGMDQFIVSVVLVVIFLAWLGFMTLIMWITNFNEKNLSWFWRGVRRMTRYGVMRLRGVDTDSAFRYALEK